MEYKINEYNDDYIIIESNQIIHILAALQINGNIGDNALIDELNQINISISDYRRNEQKKGNIYSKVDEVTIEKNSIVGKLIINKVNNPEFLCLNHFTHALLKSIDNDEWDYSEKLIFLIKKLKQLNNFKFDYRWFKLTFGEDIANYIINSISLYPSKSRSIVYLYKKGKITKKELQKKEKTKTKTRII